MGKNKYLLKEKNLEPDVRPSIKPLRDSALRTSANWISQIIISLVLIISARNYSFESFSFLATSLAISTGLVSLVDLGTTAQWTVTLSNKTISLSSWRSLLEYKFNVGILIVLMSCLVGVFVGPIALASGVLFILILSQHSLNVYFTTTNKNQFSAYSAIIDRTIAFLLCLAFLALPIQSNQTIFIFLPFLIGPLASVTFLYFNISKSIRPRFFRTYTFGRYARGSKWFAITSIASSLRGIDIILLGLWSTAMQTSLYASVSKMVVPLNTAASALSTVTTPHFSNRGLNSKVLRSVRSPILLLLCVCAVALMPIMFSNQLVIFLLGAKYVAAGPVLVILLVAGVASAISIFLTATLEAVGKALSSSLVSAFALSVQIVACVILLPSFGAIGAAYAFAIATILSVLMLLLLVAKAFREV
jgi:O-antigen/teichoic acid export membrane protein